MFKFDELAVEKKFRNRLDEYTLGVITVRPEGAASEYGTRVLLLDKLVAQDNPDAINIIVRQLTESLSRKIAVVQATTSRVLMIGPMQFEYGRGRFDNNGNRLDDGGEDNATEVLITVQIEELGA